MKSIRLGMQHGLDDGVFPGAVLLVAHQGSIVFCEAFGVSRLPSGPAVTTKTVFDLASLTKPLATALSCMVLVQQATLDLEATLGDLLAPFRNTEKKDITLRHLLSHRSGLPAYQPYFETLRTLPEDSRLEDLRRRLVKEPLSHEPASRCVYSDLGFMILQWVLEKTSGMKLDRLVEQSVYEPLGLRDLFFNPLGRKRGGCIYAATEDCHWRGRVMLGEVHDDNAHVVGGIAGHAGLFGTAEAVCSLLQELLETWREGAIRGLFLPETVRTFFQRQPDDGSWALGFDTPTRPDSSSGRYFSDSSVGHLGFTGTSFWMDLEKEVIVVLLTNRVHPTRGNEKIREFRPLIHDTIMVSLGVAE